ncbi:uncharacterized protein LOC100122685 [Nasonia vitripennis]|uniref:Uncharacterized protein n=1 Tax=Nasonia vitripennis TaxID=7425 RepID=A0A7M7QPR1_NASVI|nr:uncharacterized protein LOC100122685 [Nasonia vitripennis]XP_008217832.1 uncharacterized protein LOC100122685 [Nasonia vitripennis]XP_032452757.1 uncharacterized protein LOC100122685 [Nasonia vitripennis]
MKSFKLVHLLLLLFLLSWDEVSCLCSLDQTTAARCHDLEDARYIETYHLHTLRAPSYSRVLAPGNFRNLTSLRHLDLSGGRIESIESGSFAKLGSLQTLNLAENKLRHLEAGAFDGLKHVHSLRLGNNAIRQLPSALMSLKELRLLDLSSNPLNCNCPSLKLRDALLARGVKISKKTTCAEPASVKHASILKPDTKMTCLFEKQDEEMQADQPIDEGSGEAEPINEEDETLDEAEKDLDVEEKDVEQPEIGENEAETLPPASSPEPSSSVEPAEVSSSEDLSVTTIASRDDITFDDTEREATTSIPVEEKNASDEPIVSSSSETVPEGVMDDLVYAVAEKKNTTDVPIVSSSSTKPEKTDEIIVPDVGSGETDADVDEGSGSEGSGMIARMPAIDFNETGAGPEEEEVQISPSSTTSTSTTTEGSIWGGWNLGSVLSNLNPFGSSETTEQPQSPEKSAEEEIKEDGFIPAGQEPPKPEVFDVVEDPVLPPKIVVPDEALKQSPRTLEAPKEVVAVEETNDLTGPEMSTESKKGMGSYIVLAALLAILAGLIGIAAYKGDFCRKKRKRNDVERGTELKDMQRSLLEQNAGAVPPKIQANGNTMENVPLMTCAPPEEPKDNQRSYDITPTAPLTNGNGRAVGVTQDTSDPVKPPRKGQEIEAPLNGLNPPMEAIDAVDDPRTSLHSNCSDELLQNGGDYDGEGPPLSPGAQRVKITMQDNPDSVPKTPILITRLKGGENLVKTP